MAIFAAVAGVKDAEVIFREELAALPHDLHEWWEGPCNCSGHLN